MFTAKLEAKKNATMHKVKDLVLAIELYQEWKREVNKKIQRKYREDKKQNDQLKEPAEIGLDEFELISLHMLKAYQQLDKYSLSASALIKEKVETIIKDVDDIQLLRQALSLK